MARALLLSLAALAAVHSVDADQAFWRAELAAARRRLGGIAPSATPSASATVGPTGSASPSPSVSATASRTASRTTSATPTASHTVGASATSSPLPPIVVKLSQHVTIFSVQQLVDNVGVARGLRRSFTAWAQNTASSLRNSKVRVSAFIDSLTRARTVVAPGDPVNLDDDSRRLVERMLVEAAGGAALEYTISIPTENVAGDVGGHQTRSEAAEAAALALVQMQLADGAGNFTATVIPTIQALAASIGVNSSGLQTVLGWADVDVYVPWSSTPTPAKSSKISAGAVGGIVVGLVVGAAFVWLIILLARRRRRNHEQDSHPADWAPSPTATAATATAAAPAASEPTARVDDIRVEEDPGRINRV